MGAEPLSLRFQGRHPRVAAEPGGGSHIEVHAGLGLLALWHPLEEQPWSGTLGIDHCRGVVGRRPARPPTRGDGRGRLTGPVSPCPAPCPGWAGGW